MPMIDGSDSSSIKNVQYIPSVTLHLSDHIFLQVIVANNYTFGSLMFDITSGLPDWVGFFLLDWVGLESVTIFTNLTDAIVNIVIGIDLMIILNLIPLPGNKRHCSINLFK